MLIACGHADAASGDTRHRRACPPALAVLLPSRIWLPRIAFSAFPLSDADGMQHRFSLSFAENGVRMDVACD